MKPMSIVRVLFSPTIKAKLLGLVIFLILVLIFSGYFLQSTLNGNVEMIKRQSALIEILRTVTAAEKINYNLRGSYREFVRNSDDEDRKKIKNIAENFQQRIPELRVFAAEEAEQIEQNVRRIVSHVDMIGFGGNTDATIGEDLRLFAATDQILEALNNSIKILISDTSHRTLLQTDLLQLIPVIFIVGGFFTIVFAVAVIALDIFIPMSRLTRAMIEASKDASNAQHYILKNLRRDEIGEAMDALNHLLLEASAGIMQLRLAGDKLQAIVDNVADGLIIIDERGIIQSFSPSAERIFGYSESETTGQNVNILMGERDRRDHDAHIEQYLRTGQARIIGRAPRELTGVKKDGTVIPIELAVGKADYEGGAFFVGAVRDISVRKKMERLLEQAQRIETMGRMTGGVAHDFNNMLTVISGNLELLERRVEDERGRELLSTAHKAVESGKGLTQRLLAFSRKQILQPEVISLRERLPAMVNLMKRALGESVEIRTPEPPEETGDILVDPLQLESALLNLAINAGDAMPGGGTLTIETSNVDLEENAMPGLVDVVPGRYVMIAVTDTGTGIPPDIIDRVFDPFFTTKDVGKGTGLGLSMVYGFTRQSGGHVKLYSEPGEGTSVRLYFPLAVSRMRPRPAPAPDAGIPGGMETILVVEDEKGVLDYLSASLTDLGYSVISADCGETALKALEEIDHLDLLITDVVMPGGLNGEQLSEMAARKFPRLHILFISGYTRDALTDKGTLRAGVSLLSKPFRTLDLAVRIRQLFDTDTDNPSGAATA